MPDQTPSMPPLPEPDAKRVAMGDHIIPYWNEKTVLAYAQAVADERVREALERAAAACLDEAVQVAHEEDLAYNRATEHCAEAVRALPVSTLSLGTSKGAT